MKTRSTMALWGLAIFLCTTLPTGAADDKQLQNMKGAVSFQRANAPKPKPLANNATILLADNDYTLTGADSLAGVVLADSSRVLVGSNSKVQLAFFNQAEGNNAKFIVYNGRVRFIVMHPQGATANYTFKTSAADIAVRGTEGDVLVQNDGSFTVNVYEVCDASLPVVVTTRGGATYQLNAGQALVAQVVNGVVKAQVEQLTQQLIDRFSPDFGVPGSWDAAKGQVIASAQGRASQAADEATGGLASEVTGKIGGLFGHKAASASPSPGPTPASCSHP